MIFPVTLLGLATGCRTMMPIAVLCWFSYLGPLPLQGTWGFWTAKLVTVIVFTVLAAGELIGDKLPKTPNRTAPGPLAARVVFGALVGALVATGAGGTLAVGACLGAVAAVAGTFLGYHLRRSVTSNGRMKDMPVALVEDGLVIFASIAALHSVAR